MIKQSVYRRHLGTAFDHLPLEVQHFHDLSGTHRLQGRVTVQGAESLLGRLVAWVFRLPHSCTNQPLSFQLEADDQMEVWTRHFPGRRMRSRLSNRNEYLVEDFGPVRLWFLLRTDADQLSMNLYRLSVFKFTLPKWLTPKAHAVETAAVGCIHFDVAAWLPGDRLMVAYKGYLVLPAHTART